MDPSFIYYITVIDFFFSPPLFIYLFFELHLKPATAKGDFRRSLSNDQAHYKTGQEEFLKKKGGVYFLKSLK